MQSLEALWSKERQLYTEQLQSLEQPLVEAKKNAIEQQTQIMQLKVQLESSEGQLQAQVSRTLVASDDCSTICVHHFRNDRWTWDWTRRTRQF
jgi:hypothetical protein